MTWAPVQAMMNVRALGVRDAVWVLLTHRRFEVWFGGIEGKTIACSNARSIKTVQASYRAIERRRKENALLADDCTYWLSVFELSIREDIPLLIAFRRLKWPEARSSKTQRSSW